MARRGTRQAAALIIVGALSIGTLAVVAQAGSVQDTTALRVDLLARIEQLQERRREGRVEIHRQVRKIREALAETPRMTNDDHRYRRWRRQQRQLIDQLRKEENVLIDGIRARIDALRMRRVTLAEWLEVYGVFRACPVGGEISIADNFGVIREMPGTPRHIHTGVDIGAPAWAPIVAPFPGTAVASESGLGGLEVKVYGEAGHVYNAHLSGYGKLGDVSTGDVVGYVGETGNALGPHDHFGWYPGGGGAVDPYDLLAVAC
jgi:murein DD-endopeptidase MepM/ murein hydrolase activator NlpD